MNGTIHTALYVKELQYYPLKSGKALSLDEAVITGSGILHDRELMVVDAHTFSFITQRQNPRMALIAALIEDNVAYMHAKEIGAVDFGISKNGKVYETKVHKNLCRVVDQGDGPADLISSVLGKDCKVVAMAGDFTRFIKEKYRRNPTDHIYFADGLPFHLVSESSLLDLNARLTCIGHHAIAMNRFRPNIVIDGVDGPIPPYIEDHIARFRIGDIEFYRAKPCERCVIPTIDQDTALQPSPGEPTATLSSYRTILMRNDEGEDKPKVIFGQMLTHSGWGSIKVDDPIEVLEWSDPGYRWIHKIA